MPTDASLPRVVLAIALALAAVGCGDRDESGARPGPTTFQPTHSVTVETAYYVTGPQQARPPDGRLAAGTLVRVVEDAGSYLRVETQDGVTAYVARDALKPQAP